MAIQDIRSNVDLARAFGDINKSYLNKGYTATPKTTNINITRGQLPSYTRTTSNINITPQQGRTTSNINITPQQGEADLLIQSAYSQIMDRASGGSSGLYQGGQQGLSKDGFYGSMPSLEAASMRLADAALGRELISTQAKGQQEKSLQELRGTQEYGLQELRGTQEYGLQELRGTQEYGLQGLRGAQEYEMLSQRANEERKSEIEKEIRLLERERAEVGSRPYSINNRFLYDSIGNQIQNLRNQLR